MKSRDLFETLGKNRNDENEEEMGFRQYSYSLFAHQ
jgi:hypothetical protein